ncbi:hypothetical protein D047_2292A, partial [Vibrio parahaemolyticus VPTS-2010_2]
MTRYSLEG